MNSHNSENLIKHKDMDLKIIGIIVLDLINIIAQNTCKNKLIIMIKNHQASKGERVNKGEPVRRIMRGKC